MLQKEYTKRGVEFLLGAKVTSVGSDCVNYELGGKQLSAKADRVLISIGRRAMTQGIGLENIGVLTERGAIVTNDYGQTNVAGVWAAGDVTADRCSRIRLTVKEKRRLIICLAKKIA